MTFTPRTISILAFLTMASAATFACGDEDGPEGDTDGQGGEAGEAIQCDSDKDCSDVDGLCDLGRSVCVDCFTDAHCNDAEICSANQCVEITPCESSKDCGTDQVCDTGLGYCVECVGDNDCGDEQVCLATRCATACSSDTDCTSNGQVCNLEAGGCQECLTAADCADGMTCSATGACVTDLSGDGDGDGDGIGGMSGDGDGDQTGDGDGDAVGCRPEVRVLLQRSGAMFENPSSEDSWWHAISAALGPDGGDLLSAKSSSLDIAISTFHMTESSCPIINDAPSAASEVAAFLAAEEQAHDESGEKIDAPLPEAIADAVSSFSGTDNRYLILAVSGNPDSCEEQDGLCAIEPTVEALQAASDAGITTKLLYLSSSDAYDGYEQALANAGAGEDVAEMDGLGNACGTDPTYYSQSGGSAPFEAPESTSQVQSSLQSLLDSIGSCQ